MRGRSPSEQMPCLAPALTRYTRNIVKRARCCECSKALSEIGTQSWLNNMSPDRKVASRDVQQTGRVESWALNPAGIYNDLSSVLLFTSLLAIPLACQCFFDALLFAGLQIEGVTLHFLDDVLLLNLALEATQCIFKRLALLYANLCQETTPPNRPNEGPYRVQEMDARLPPKVCVNLCEFCTKFRALMGKTGFIGANKLCPRCRESGLTNPSPRHQDAIIEL